MKVEIRKILCPIDFSENADHALRYALELAGSFNAELHLLHVFQPPVVAMPTDPLLPGLSSEIVADLSKAAEEQFDALAAKVARSYARTTSCMATGTPFYEIIRVAKDLPADMIVMGTHGRTGLAHMIIGSVAEKVVRKAPCAVLTVKHPRHEFVMP